MTDLGYRPLEANLLLNAGADFDLTLTTSEPAWGSVAVRLEFADGTVWPAVVTGADAVFAVPADVSDVPDSGQRVELVLVEGTHRTVYSTGKVLRA